MKLRKLHIDDYKMFKDFDISFVDENDEALSIVVLAGVNGSGKTTLLEFIYYNEDNRLLLDSDTFSINDGGDVNTKNYIERLHNEGTINITNTSLSEEDQKILKRAKERFETKQRNNMIYFPSEIDEIYKIKKEFIKSWYDFLKNHDYRPSEVKEHFDNYMQDVFNDLDLTFKYSHLDRDDNVWFTNDNGEQFEIKDLSTGEKTLLSKVMYLYFLDYKDKVILIDEPELSLHPSWQNKVLKIYENFAIKNNCQIIIATHSPHIIASAKNEYLRFLIKNEEGKIEAIENITAYGRDIEWVLEQMGVTDTRVPKITKRFNEIQELINNQEFDKAESALDKLEYVIGENDKDILALRNDLAFERIDFEEDN